MMRCTRRSLNFSVAAALPLAALAPTRLWAATLLDQVERHFLQQPANSAVVQLTFHPASGSLAIGYESGQIDVWDGGGAAKPLTFRAHRVRANRIQFARSGDHLLSNSYFDDETRVWDVHSGLLLHTIPKTSGPVIDIGSERIVVVASSNALHLYEHASHRLSPPAVPAMTGVPVSLASHAATNTVAVGTASGTLDLWRVDGDSIRAEVWRLASARPATTGDWIVGTGFSADGRSVYSVSRSGVIAEWSVERLERKRTIQSSLGFVHTARFKSDNIAAIAGTVARSGVEGGALELLALDQGHSIGLHRDMSTQAMLAFVPARKLLVVISKGQLLRIPTQ
jgi:hypothetical protein